MANGKFNVEYAARIHAGDKVADPVGVAPEAEVGGDGGRRHGEEDDALEPVGHLARYS